MKAASLSEIKKELSHLSENELVNLCLSLAKYKKDNKEYLGYLLFDESNRELFITNLKLETDNYFSELKSQHNLYYLKKGLRKILRILNRYNRYINDKAVTAEILIYFCSSLLNSGKEWRKNKLIVNMYQQQLKKINTIVTSLHEDLQQDFMAEIEKITY